MSDESSAAARARSHVHADRSCPLRRMDLTWYLSLSAVLFTIGVLGADGLASVIALFRNKLTGNVDEMRLFRG